jgi:hypothetical protein
MADTAEDAASPQYVRAREEDAAEEEEEAMPPVVLIGGFLAPAGRHELYWGDSAADSQAATTTTSGRRVIPVSISPVGSVHDRACEIFYALKGGGGRVDFGAGHASEHGHSRYGAAVAAKGLYPAWGRDHPIDLVGHSLGGQTARYLQHLLAGGDFFSVGAGQLLPTSEGNSEEDDTSTQHQQQQQQQQHQQPHCTSSAWVRSVTTLSSPLNGTSVVYVKTLLFFCCFAMAKRSSAFCLSRPSLPAPASSYRHIPSAASPPPFRPLFYLSLSLAIHQVRPGRGPPVAPAHAPLLPRAPLGRPHPLG